MLGYLLKGYLEIIRKNDSRGERLDTHV